MAKFDPLKEYFLHLPEHQTDITLPFGQVEKIIGSELPPAAFKFRAYWGNNAEGGHVHARAWMDAGWKVDSVDQNVGWVRFVRQNRPVKPKNFPEPVGKGLIEPPRRTTEFSANRPNKTLVIHKPDCRVIPWEQLDPCGCGDMGELGNQHWYCERHISIDAVNEFMHGRFWAILLCDICFRGKKDERQVRQAEPIGPLEELFRQEMCKVALFANENGFGQRFKLMIQRWGAVETAKRLLAKREIQPGLIQLQQLGRLDTSMEALVIQERFRLLFTEAEIAEARRRLKELGFFK